MKLILDFIGAIHKPPHRRLAALTCGNPPYWRPLAADDLSPVGTAGVKTGRAASNDARRRYQLRWYSLLVSSLRPVSEYGLGERVTHDSRALVEPLPTETGIEAEDLGWGHV
jgi:hypothetical protein